MQALNERGRDGRSRSSADEIRFVKYREKVEEN